MNGPLYEPTQTMFRALHSALPSIGGGPARRLRSFDAAIRVPSTTCTTSLCGLRHLSGDRRPSLATRVAHAGCEVDPTTGGLTPAIHLASTFERDVDLEYRRGFMYGRAGNPTRSLLERTMADLEGGADARAFASGVAVAAGLFQAMPGGVVVMPDDAYHGNRTLLQTVFADWGLQWREVDMTDLAAVEAALEAALADAGGAADKVLLWTETPSNPRLKVTDIAAVSELARAVGVPHACDATWLTPCLVQPLALGADLVVHSTTKYLGGHSDMIGGGLVVGAGGDTERVEDSACDAGSDGNDGAFSSASSSRAAARRLFDRAAHIQVACGAVPAPFDCFLALRGIRSLRARMQLHSSNAQRVASFLDKHPAVTAVYYPGLADHPGHSVMTDQLRGAAASRGSKNSGRSAHVASGMGVDTEEGALMFGGMLSFEVKGGEEAAVRVAAATELFKRATSLGGTESLVEHRASIEPPDSPTPRGLLRLSVGLECAYDLVEDLEQALQAASDS